MKVQRTCLFYYLMRCGMVLSFSFSVSDAWKTSMLKDEFEQKLIQVDRDEKEARKRESEKHPPRSDWGREAFSTRFSCHFCGEVGSHFEHC